MSLVIADTGAIISLIHVKKFDLIEKVFGNYFIPNSVWIELNKYDHSEFDKTILKKIEPKIREIKSKNYLLNIMHYGESESVILYEELMADFLLIDDNKARKIAESFGINCIGTLGLLIKAKQNGFITELKPIFDKLLTAFIHKINSSNMTSIKNISILERLTPI